jgi:hypothetical protein
LVNSGEASMMNDSIQMNLGVNNNLRLSRKDSLIQISKEYINNSTINGADKKQNIIEEINTSQNNYMNNTPLNEDVFNL